MPQLQQIRRRGDRKEEALGRGIAQAGRILGRGLVDSAEAKQEKATQAIEQQKLEAAAAEKAQRQEEGDIGRLVNAINGFGSPEEAEILQLVPGFQRYQDHPAVVKAMDSLVGVEKDMSHIKEARRLAQEMIKGLKDRQRRQGEDLAKFLSGGNVGKVIGDFTDRTTEQLGGGDQVRIGEIRQEIENSFRALMGDTKFDTAIKSIGGSQEGVTSQGGSPQPQNPIGAGLADSDPQPAPQPLSPVEQFSQTVGESFIESPEETGVPPAWYQMIKSRPVFTPQVMKAIDEKREAGFTWDEIMQELKEKLPGNYKVIQDMIKNPLSRAVGQAGR